MGIRLSASEYKSMDDASASVTADTALPSDGVMNDVMDFKHLNSLTLPTEFSSIQKRAITAIVGSIVADAAAQPLHFIADSKSINEILEQSNAVDPAFLEVSANPRYKLDTGQQSCFGDQILVLLESLTNKNGIVDENDIFKRIVRYFGRNSAYEPKDPTQRPLPCPLRTTAIQEIVSKSLRLGLEDHSLAPVDDFNADCMAKLAPIVALYSGHREMLSKVEKVARVTQNNSKSVAICLAAARILEHCILKGYEKDVLTSVYNELKNPNRILPTEEDSNVADMIQNILDMKSRSHIDVVSHTGHSSAIAEVFQCSLHVLLTAKSYVDGIRSTMVAGGCNCSRCAYVGACLSAQHGIDSIPMQWVRKASAAGVAYESAKKLVKMRSG